MTNVTVMYANVPGARFDHEYYLNTHMPLTKERMGDHCKYYAVEKGLMGGEPGAPPPYVAQCHIFCESVEAFLAGFMPNMAELVADIPNYTDIPPTIQISEVVGQG